MQIAYRFRSVGTPPPLRLFTGWCGYLHVFNLQLSKKIKEMNIRHALMENSLFFCDCCVSLFCLSYVYYSMRVRDRLYWCTTKTLCVSPFIRAKEVFPSLPSSSSLSLFLVQVLFCFNEENRDTWMDTILGWGLRWVQRRRESWKTCKDLTPLFAEP